MLSTQKGIRSGVIQDRAFLYRESMRILLLSTSSFENLHAVADCGSLVEACQTNEVGVVVFEAANVPWDVSEMLETVRSCLGDVTLVGTYPYEHRRHKVIQGVHYVPRGASYRSLLAAAGARAGDPGPMPGAGPEQLGGNRFGFSPRDLQVLALMGGGLTTEEMASRLELSVKTIENRRQALFAKLGVRNQSHAVAVAMRSGLLAVGSVSEAPS